MGKIVLYFHIWNAIYQMLLSSLPMQMLEIQLMKRKNDGLRNFYLSTSGWLLTEYGPYVSLCEISCLSPPLIEEEDI